MFRNRKEVDNYMYESCEPTCHECTSKDEVQSYKEDIVVEKEELIVKKDMENKKIMRTNMKISSTKVNYEKTIDVNNEFKLNVDEQQDAINHLKEQCDICD